ncbi:MAG: hypothetical protein Q8N46_01630 [Anaerolineales bacterium]|nr:hypothetical protein [Anaerolineales bacterium]
MQKRFGTLNINPAFLAIILLTATALACGFGAPATPVLGELDFGDAPDPSYPSLLASNGARTHDLTAFWLGFPDLPPSSETDANIVDRDELDDGLIRSFATAGKVFVTFQVVKSGEAASGVVYFNLLADANNDGQWEDIVGAGGAVQEWVVRNFELTLNPGDERTIDASIPLVGGNLELWIRAMVTDKPVPEGNFPQGWDGTYPFGDDKAVGEVEDYYFGVSFFIPPETPTHTATVTPTPTSTVTPTPTKQRIIFTLDPRKVRAGQKLTITGSGLTPNGHARKEFDCSGLIFSFDTTADNQGNIYGTLDTTGMSPGVCTITITDQTTGAQVQDTFEIIP